jgi:TP901 family phage tail tape measure protein
VALRTVGVRLTADVSSYMSNMKRAGTATKDFTGEMTKAAKGGQLDHVADRAGVAGLSLVGLAGYAVKSAADFEKSMSAVSAATHASAKDIDSLRQAALQAGKDTQYSATGAADAITELSKAGVATADILNGGLRGALSLAAAGQMDVGEAAETAASAMTQFKLKGSQVPHVADLLAAAAGKAQGSVHDMGQALNQSGLVAAQFGLSIEDTTGVLAEFASAGLMGSDAGTSLKTMLLAIANPSKQTRDLMDQLGISFYDATGKFIGMSGVAQVLQQRLKGLTDAQRQQALGQIFGNDAIRAASILYTDGATGVDKWKTAVDDSGYAAETAAKLTDNLAGDIERLKGSLETMAIEAGGGANGGLRIFVKTLGTLVDQLGSLPPFITSTLTVMAGLSGGALLLGAAWIKTRKTTAAVREEFEAMGPAGAKAAAGMSKLSGAATKVGVVFAVLETAGAVISQFQDELKPQLDAMAAGLEEYAASGKVAGESSRVLGDNMKDLKYTFDILADTDNTRKAWARGLQGGLESLITPLQNTNTSLARTKERVESVDGALAQMVASGNTKAANDAFQKLASELATGGVSMEEFRKQFPQYAAAVESAGAATKDTASKTGDLTSALQVGADAQGDYATEADAAAAAARGEREAFNQLSQAIKAQIDPVFGLLDAEDDLTKARKAATEATKKYGRNSDEAREANRKLAMAAVALQAAVGGLGSTFNGKLTPSMMATFKAAGLTEGQIKDVAKQFRNARSDAEKYDDKYEAKASAPGATKAKKELDLAYTSANHFAGPYIARLTVSGDKTVNDKLAALLIKQRALASGLSVGAARAAVQKDLDRNRVGAYYDGGWTGPGGKYEPAGVVHGDEFVIKKESRRKIEAAAPGLLDDMNATGQAPGYWTGGRVMTFKTNVSKTDIPPGLRSCRRWP